MNNNSISMSTKWLIAGPCALESRTQLQKAVQVLKKMGIAMVRACLCKPRTQPGWEGIGFGSLQLLLEETIPHGVVPATELMTAEHAMMVVNSLEDFGEDAKIIVWLGSRNQNHVEQKNIAKILATGPEGITLMFKNQMWEDERHWFGIYEHLLSGGFPKERMLSCHRGFSPGKLDNPNQYRNVPDFEMAMRMKERMGIPMLIDPSHMGGSSANVLKICQFASTYAFDGYMIEVHADPEHAKTDAGQQLSYSNFAELLKIIPSADLTTTAPHKGE
jgi:chorismate mutase